MKRYMIASDYDGTISYEGKISQADHDAIARFREAGHLFGLVTGRLTQTALIAAHTVGHDFTIACSGGVIFDASDTMLWDKTVPGDGKLSALYTAAKDCGTVNFLVSTAQSCYEFDVSTAKPEDIVIPKGEGIQEVCFYCPKGDGAPRFAAQYREAFEDSYAIHLNGGSVDMPACGVSKKTGILKAAEIFGIETENIFCVGDQTNDLPMVTAFKGFAVSNAVPALKEAAPYSCNRICDMIDRILSGEFDGE